jgi:hypothetical protein
MADVWSCADAVRWRQPEDRGEGNMVKAPVHEVHQMDDARAALEGLKPGGCLMTAGSVQTMTREQLAALAVYRNHKHCECPECEMARAVLKEMDSKGARSTAA